MSKNIYSYIRKEYETYKHYSDSTIKKLLPNLCSILKSVQNDVKKEYEEKLRWIPVEEKLPEKENKNGNLSSTSKVVQVKSINFSEPFCAFYNYVQKCWVSYPYLSGSEIHGITSWRSFL